MKKRRRRKNIWAEYERRKRNLAQRPQPSAQYEQQIQMITREMKI